MSKFIDKLNRLSQNTPQPIGFRTKQPDSPKPKIQLVVSLDQEDAEGLADYVAGADTGLLRISKLNPGIKTLQKISQAVSDIPWGLWLKDGSHLKIEQMAKAGCDFMAFPPSNTPLTIIQNDEVGKVLEIEASLTEGLLRAVNELPIDAVLIAGEWREGFLTWQPLMLFQRFADLLTKPLLVSIPSSVTAGELQTLWEAGVDSVVIEVTTEQPQDMVKKLRQVIDELAFPLPRKREKAGPLLPRIGMEPSTVAAEEEEEEEEEP